MPITLLTNLRLIIGSSLILGGLSSCEQEQAPSREANEESGFLERDQDRLIVRLPTNTPDGWELQSRIKGPRASTFRIPATDEEGVPAVMTVTRFPGTVGGLLANVNRWRKEAGLPVLKTEELDGATEELEVGAHELRFVKAIGETRATLGAILPLPHQTWVFKLSGPPELVAAQESAFRTYLANLTVTSKNAPPAPPPPRPNLVYTVPEGWTEGAASIARIASFTLNDEEGRMAEVAIIPLEGSGGPQLSIVNQWRSQVGLDPTDSSTLPELLEEHRINGLDFKIADFLGEDSPSGGEPTRLLVAFAKREHYTWFFKMTGDATLVGQEEKPLMEFLHSLRFVAPDNPK